MATVQQPTITKAELDANFDDMEGYVDTAIGTLTDEMDRQFKEVRGDIAQVDAKVDTLDAKVDTLDAKVDTLDAKADTLDANVQSWRTWA